MSNMLIIDTELTQLDIRTERLYEISLVEVDENFQRTGRKFYQLFNPEKPLVNTDKFQHKYTDEDLRNQPVFAEVARDLFNFIGKSRIVITCWTVDEHGKPFTATLDNMEAPKEYYTADIAFLNKEFQIAGFPPIRDEQWFNARRIFEAVMEDHKKASLNYIVPFLNFKEEDFNTAHTAEPDVDRLIAVLPPMMKMYEKKRAAWLQASSSRPQYPQKFLTDFLLKP